MLRGNQNIVRGESLKILARWFVKTATVINVSQPYRLLWDADRRHQVETGVPANVRVSLYWVPEPDLNWVQGSIPSASSSAGASVEGLTELIGLTHVCEIQVGNLVGVVIALPDRLGGAVVQAPGAPLWPPPSGGVVDLKDLQHTTEAFDGLVHLITRPSAFWR